LETRSRFITKATSLQVASKSTLNRPKDIQVGGYIGEVYASHHDK
jgi:hypothetical protein